MFDVIVACTEDGGIGLQGTIPWYIPEDLRHFARITKNGVVIMGRNTWDSLPNKPLPDRINIIVTSRPFHINNENTIAVTSLQAALDYANENHPSRKAFIIGGERLYTEALVHPECSDVHITKVMNKILCDTHFPLNLLSERYRIVANGFPKYSEPFMYVFETYERRLP